MRFPYRSRKRRPQSPIKPERQMRLLGVHSLRVSMGAEGCSLCGGVATYGTLPTECPNIEMTEDMRWNVAHDILNFIGGRWVRKTTGD